MDAAHLLDALRTEGDVAMRAAQDREAVHVPHLDWTVGEVVEHLGGVYERFTRCLRREVDAWPDRATVQAPAADVVGWARERLGRVVTVVGSADLDAAYTTWAGPRDGRWVLRRLVNETAVHRWDLEAATGTADALPVEVALGVVEEFLTDVVTIRGLAGVDDADAHDGATLHLHATDDGLGDGVGEWFVTLSSGAPPVVEHRHAKGDVAIRGPAGDLALWINGRLPPSRLDAFGDGDLVDWWTRVFRFD